MVRRIRFSIAFSVMGLLGVGCALSTNETSSQCHSQEDCLARGADFADTTCSEERLCVKLNVQGRSCSTHRECADRNGGAPFICRTDGRCVSLLTADCQKVLGDKDDLLNDNTIFIGHVDVSDINGATGEQALDLARAEIKKQLAGGLPPAKPGGPKRPLAVVVCTTEPAPNTGLGSVESTDRALRHLADDLLIPIQNGPWTVQMAVRGASYAVDRKQLMFSQNATSDLTRLQDNDLVFRSGFPESNTVALLPKFITDYLTPQIYALGIAQPDEPIRVALVLDTGFNLVAEAAAKVITQQYQVFNVGELTNPIDNPNPQPKVTRGIIDVTAYKPHVILYAGGPSAINGLLVPISKGWPAATPRPFQMTLLASSANFVLAALQNINNPVVTQRFFGLQTNGLGFNPNDAKVVNQNLLLRFPELGTLPTAVSTMVTYDTMYLLAQAIVANGDQPITGPNMAAAVRKVADVTGGAPVPWGPEGLSAGFASLGRGQNLALNGVTGAWLLDKAGDRPGNPEVYCVTQTGGKPSTIVSSGYSLDSTSGQVVGTVANCN